MRRTPQDVSNHADSATSSRREFLGSSVAKLAFAVASTAAFSAATTGCRTRPASTAGSVAERLSCSTLAKLKSPTEEALPAIAALGFRWIDLSCLTWAPHVHSGKLAENFDVEAARVEKVLGETGLKPSNFTFDAAESMPFEKFEREFTGLCRLAERLKTRVINIMGPGAKSDRADQVAKHRRLVEIATARGVTLTIETHVGQLTEKPVDALWMCQQVPGLGLTLDPSHYYAGPNQGASFSALYPFVRGTGFRAGGMTWAEIQLPWGQGPIDFAAIIRELQRVGYQGGYVCEYLEGFNQVDALAEAGRFLAWGRTVRI